MLVFKMFKTLALRCSKCWFQDMFKMMMFKTCSNDDVQDMFKIMMFKICSRCPRCPKCSYSRDDNQVLTWFTGLEVHRECLLEMNDYFD